jgi:undecaprenyl-diphosphatase
VNRAVLDRASIQVNTFPSGHAATAVAAALATAQLLPGLLAPLLAVAGAIAVSTVVGRYHYTADTLLGVFVGAGAWWLTT